MKYLPWILGLMFFAPALIYSFVRSFQYDDLQSVAGHWKERALKAEAALQESNLLLSRVVKSVDCAMTTPEKMDDVLAAIRKHLASKLGDEIELPDYKESRP